MDFIPAQALRRALESGLIEALEIPRSPKELAALCTMELAGCQLQLQLLQKIAVATNTAAGWQLEPTFAELLEYRELICAKLTFAAQLTGDLINGVENFFDDQLAFMGEAKTFELFDYQRCYQLTEENLAVTASWVDLTSAYTRHEAPLLAELCDLKQHHLLIDFGGNSGEAALRLCQQLPSLRATVIDLPVVCEVGRRKLAGQAIAERVTFQCCDLLAQQPSGTYDLALFKSFLHDWPEPALDLFLQRAWHSLEAGGELLIFERKKTTTPPCGYGDLPILLFARFYRSPEVYINKLKQTGFDVVEQRQVDLDWPFMLLRARKPKELSEFNRL